MQSIIHYSAWHRLTFRESIADWVFPMLFDKEKNRFLPNPDCVDAITTALCEEKQERSAADMCDQPPAARYRRARMQGRGHVFADCRS